MRTTAIRPLAGLVAGLVLALAGCTADATAPSDNPAAVPSGPRCIEPVAAPSAASAPAGSSASSATAGTTSSPVAAGNAAPSVDTTPSASAAPTGASSGVPSGLASGAASGAASGVSSGAVDKSRPALPAMALQCFDGGRWTSISDLAGTPTIINLWASWCEPCRTELPAIQRVATAGAGKIRVVGIITKDRPDAARSVIEAEGLTFPMLEDRGQQFAIAVSPLVDKALVSLPATLFVTADGRIAYTYQGPALDEPKLRDLTSRYLGVTVPA